MPLISPDLLSEIISTASDIALLLTAGGIIAFVLVNPHHRSFGQLQHWEGRLAREVLTTESISKLENRLVQLNARPEGESLSVELNHSDQSDWEFPVRYSMHRLKPDGSVLMLGRDLRPIAEMQQKLVSAQMALERDYEAHREMDTRYRVLMEMTRDAIVLVAMSTGRITDLNAAAALLLGGSRSDLLGAAIAQEFEGRRRGEFLEAMSNLAVADSAAPIELQARRSQNRLVVVPLVFRAAGERMLLCRLENPAQAPAKPDELGENLTRLYHEGVDAIVFTDRDGSIRGANEAFLNLTDSPNLAAVRGRSLAEFMVRGAIDLKVLMDNARRAGQMRMYSTKLTNAFAGQIAAEVSATWMNDRPNPVLGLVIRDASRAEAMRRPGFVTTESGMNSVMELVGSSTLKDIVAETTDVVEKMCIETAVELTRNNRVAAAEMLGLSRQSLYVKLRKYGLLSKDVD
ncbi:transcriptional regulator PpsR [Paracoccaceae bacterium Fryx2]|nr:transcriptional regulator PpsR [Paracoccaceae bacterium Fryx2]